MIQHTAVAAEKKKKKENEFIMENQTYRLGSVCIDHHLINFTAEIPGLDRFRLPY